jgi:hypothetical protein
MSDEEFLKRWSRRKQEAKVAEATPPPAAPAGDGAVPSSQPEGAEPEIDLSKLPPIDSITAATDITEFLRKGIPAELSRAALRRAWAADPAIRDFVGLAENAWDFTDPNAIPGFGALQGSPAQIGAMVERVVGNVRDAAAKLSDAIPTDAENRALTGEKADLPAPSEQSADPVVHAPAASEEPAAPVAAMQPEASDDEDGGTPVRPRTHGGALPR